MVGIVAVTTPAAKNFVLGDVVWVTSQRFEILTYPVSHEPQKVVPVKVKHPVGHAPQLVELRLYV